MLLSAFGGLLLSSTIALASGCPTRPTVAEALKNSKVIFVGRVVARLKYGVRFQVETTWKGRARQYIYIYTGNLRNDSDPWFEKGEQWLVYASDVPLYRTERSSVPYTTRLMSTPCGRTTPLSPAGEDLKELGKGIEIPKSATPKKGIRR